jgi:uncharacterized membrane protein
LKKFLVRLKNPKVITAVVSGILIVLVNLGVIGVDLSAHVTDTVNTILSVGVAIGVFSNPDSHIKE